MKEHEPESVNQCMHLFWQRKTKVFMYML